MLPFASVAGFCSRSSKLTLPEVRRKRNELFSLEKTRQMALVTRVEKIKVDYTGEPETCELIMNKYLSTPYNCAMHIQEILKTRSVIALVNGRPWDMHRPLEEDCDLRFLHFKSEDPWLPNKAFWRSCSFILGYILETAFKEEFNVELCSFPSPSVKSGSFIYDARLDLEDWEPTNVELQCLSRLGGKLAYQDLKFERLEIDASLAKQMFEDNRYKSAQIPSIAAQSEDGSSVVVYRLGDHVDITRGPLMSSTDQLSRYTVTALHAINSGDFGELTRVQGLAMPKQIEVHYWTYEYLGERAAKLNSAKAPALH